MNDEATTPRLRRALFGGFSPADVETQLVRLRSTVEQLGESLRDERLRHAELAAEVESLRDELVRPRAADAPLARVAADGTATALRDELARQVNELLGVKDTLVHEVRAALRDLGAAVDRVEQGEPVLPRDGEVPPALTLDVDTIEIVGRDAAVADSPRRRPYSGRVELDVGPFAGFADLAGFERALRALPKVEDVYVRRFTGERALLELTATESLPLVGHLEAALPYRFELDAAEESRLALTLMDPPVAVRATR